MVELYFPPNSAMVTGYGFDMLYAGPREAVLHAYFRQNMGATHFIIGRDHAGVGDYYGAFDAQSIFDEEVPEGALEIEIFNADHTAWSKKLGKVVMMREAPDHTKEDFVLLSGTKVREMLSEGIAPPEEFSRPEVARILMDYYRSTKWPRRPACSCPREGAGASAHESKSQRRGMIEPRRGGGPSTQFRNLLYVRTTNEHELTRILISDDSKISKTFTRPVLSAHNPYSIKDG